MILRIFFTLLFVSGYSLAQNAYQAIQWTNGTDSINYRILYPKHFDQTKKYPVLFFLHGAGERGNDNAKQLIHGSALFASDSIQEKYPAIIIFPQCPPRTYWANAVIDRSKKPIKLDFPQNATPTRAMRAFLGFFDEFILKDFVAQDQIYVGGLSMGGMGTFELASRRPNKIAAAFAICGGGNTANTAKYASKIPFWVFHGAQDNVVHPLQSVKIVEALLQNGGKPNFNLYAKDNHNSWDSALAEPELIPWLFSKKIK